MKFLPLVFLCSIHLCSSASAVTVAFGTDSNIVSTESHSTVDTDTSQNLSITSSQELPYNNNSSSTINSNVTPLALTQPDGVDTFRLAGFNIGSVSANVDTEVTTLRDKVLAGALAAHAISFTLEAGETKLVKFFLDYNIDIANGNQNSASVSWELIAPDTSAVFMGSRALTTPIFNPPTAGSNISEDSDSGRLELIITQQGTYTLTVKAEVDEQEFVNANRTVLAELKELDFEVTNIPEPSSTALLMLASGAFLFRRKR